MLSASLNKTFPSFLPFIAVLVKYINVYCKSAAVPDNRAVSSAYNKQQICKAISIGWSCLSTVVETHTYP